MAAFTSSRATGGRGRKVAGFKAAATRASRDAEVASNIPASLVPLWNKVKGGIKGKTMEARTRAFKQYAHDHAREGTAALQAHADAKVDRLVAGRSAGSAGAESMSASQTAYFNAVNRSGSRAAELPPAPF